MTKQIAAPRLSLERLLIRSDKISLKGKAVQALPVGSPIIIELTEAEAGETGIDPEDAFPEELLKRIPKMANAYVLGEGASQQKIDGDCAVYKTVQFYKL